MMKNSVLYPITNRYRMALSLDGMWQFQFDPRSCGLAENWKNGLPVSHFHAGTCQLL